MDNGPSADKTSLTDENRYESYLRQSSDDGDYQHENHFRRGRTFGLQQQTHVVRANCEQQRPRAVKTNGAAQRGRRDKCRT